MRFLITGAEGQLGSEFVRLLSGGNMEHKALSRRDLDITDLSRVREAVKSYKADFVINCAAYNDVDKAEIDWKQAYLVNGVGVKNLLLSSAETESTFLHFSTDYVFDGGKKEPYSIADLPRPLNKYGMSKLLGENFITQLGYPGYYLIRTSWVFGGGRNSFIAKLSGWMDNKEEINIVDDQVSTPTYTGDLAGAAMELIKSKSYGLYHISNSGICSRYEWAKHIAEKAGWKGRVNPVKSDMFDSPARRPKFSALDNFPLREVTGHDLPVWQESVDRYLKSSGVMK